MKPAFQVSVLCSSIRSLEQGVWLNLTALTERGRVYKRGRHLGREATGRPKQVERTELASTCDSSWMLLLPELGFWGCMKDAFPCLVVRFYRLWRREGEHPAAHQGMRGSEVGTATRPWGHFRNTATPAGMKRTHRLRGKHLSGRSFFTNI